MGGLGGISGPPKETVNEERDGLAGAGRGLWGVWRPYTGPRRRRLTSSATAWPGRAESDGGMGAISRPPWEAFDAENENEAGGREEVAEDRLREVEAQPRVEAPS